MTMQIKYFFILLIIIIYSFCKYKVFLRKNKEKQNIISIMDISNSFASS